MKINKHDIWVEISREAMENNFKALRKKVSSKAKICAVVKANGYSHGIDISSQIFSGAGCDYLGVTHFSEAIEIRNSGINTKTLMFMPISYSNIEEAVSADLDFTVSNINNAKDINQIAVKSNKIANIHVKVDTGMGRLGVYSNEITELFNELKSLENINIAGIYTHFARSGELDIKFTCQQFSKFERILNNLKRDNFNYGTAHVCNSSASLRFPDMHLDMVRIGTALYGQFPSVYAKQGAVELQNTWKLKCKICEIRNLPVGSTVGYGSEFIARKPMKVAVISIGFADGYTMVPDSLIYRIEPLRYFIKKYSNRYHVFINGQKCDILGRIGMQMCIVNITGTNIDINDTAEIPTMRLPVPSSIPRIIIQ